MYKDNLKKNLVAIRKKRGLTQQVAADFLDIQQGTLSKYETGKLEPDIETLCRISIFYNVSLDKLLGIERTEKQ